MDDKQRNLPVAEPSRQPTISSVIIRTGLIGLGAAWLLLFYLTVQFALVYPQKEQSAATESDYQPAQIDQFIKRLAK